MGAGESILKLYAQVDTEDTEWLYLAQDRNQQLAVANTITNLLVS
jgi:hypothetical protein